jgi:hypothetical protein
MQIWHYLFTILSPYLLALKPAAGGGGGVQIVSEASVSIISEASIAIIEE